MNDGKKKKSQKHKNKTAFKITFDTQALQQQKKVSLNNLCIRCSQQIQWKLQYNKYKKMSEPARCNFCQQKNVFRTYMKACQQCVVAKNVCAKCLTPDYEQPQQVKVSEKEQKKEQKTTYNKQIDFMKTLQQRSRRTIRRCLQKGKISWDNQQQYFVDEQGNKMIGLHFRKGFANDQDGDKELSEDIMNQDDDMFGEDDEDFEDFSNDQDTDEKNQNKSSQNNKAQQIRSQTIKNDKIKNLNNDQEKQDQNNSKKNDGQLSEKNSDLQGDEVECDDGSDFEDDEDIQFEDEEEEQQQEQKNKKNNKKK